MESKKVVYSNKKGSKSSTTRANKNRISKRRPLNRFSLEKDTENVSTSAKKLKMSEGEYEIQVDRSFGYRFINFIAVFSAISELVVCKKCGSNIKFNEACNRGLGFKIVVVCDKCEPSFINASPLINNHAYDINRRIIFAMRLLGIGLNGITKFCAFMDLPHPIFQSFYDTVVGAISVATTAVCEKSIKKAVAEEKKISLEQGQTTGLTVSGDGSWRKRGFSSLFGIAALIGWHTGKILDVLVKSKYCKACEFWNTKKDAVEYEEWSQLHNEECDINHEGSSGKIEVDAIVEMFSRSETLHGVKYCQYIGDGDSKTFKGIIDAQPYADITVSKKECIDHVQKRMGTRLRDLKKKTKGLGEKGKLTGKLIDELTIYYGLSIRRNCNSIEKMKKEIWATLYHKISTDEKPQHDYCPSGADSWCSWQKAKAFDNLEEYTHKTPLNKEVFNVIRPIYEDLSNDDLLNRCLGGFTQNNNESFNAVVWSLAPKTFASGQIILDIATDIAVCKFNDGFASIMAIMQVLNMTIGHNMYTFCIEADARRVKAAERAMSSYAKEARKLSRMSRKEEDEANFDVEGQLYGAGIAE
ncbi:hypothetical protein ALC62_14605 [Cyphomyrmex costatus]|uniref:Mutator-like transposase domain-containing protein n=1 Tax=Cyphomyrmex costatus TaxID=456900 RepID=A0A151I913_9HYME|nr:hypothetical protein ALC62_14605 [Cyphomyrmex costatus]